MLLQLVIPSHIERGARFNFYLVYFRILEITTHLIHSGGCTWESEWKDWLKIH